MKLEFLDRFLKNTHRDEISQKSIQWEMMCSMWRDGWMDGQT